MNNFNKLIRTNYANKKLFIFDLDKTLWNFNAERNKSMDKFSVMETIYPHTFPILNYLRGDYKLAIASKGWYPNVSYKYMKYANLTVYFDHIEIYPTGLDKKYPYNKFDDDKRSHIIKISDILDIDYKDSVFVDDDIKNVLKAKVHFPDMKVIHCKNGIDYDIF